ncbi:MAG: hypothetical protein DI603_16495 [Roseateles depolymerans]|uniref:Uncharacterized protein n=1 Tax=Roseateles depolymerans TaxID=76731 RepID=A0A2W5FJG7_9BURK|nr:MAG: hypothetical protein DI603_16495 [Roseateles depolymerans]
MVSASSSITTGPGLLATALRRAFSDPPVPVRPAPLPQAAGTRSADGQPSSVVSLSQESRLMADLSSLADRIASTRAERQATDGAASTVQDGVTQQLSASVEASRQAAEETLASLGQRLSAPEDQPNVGPAATSDLVAGQTPDQAPDPADRTSDLARIEANAQNARQTASADAAASGEQARPTPPDAQALPRSLQNQLQQASAAYAQVAQLQPAAAQPTRTSESAAAPASHAEQHSPTA